MKKCTKKGLFLYFYFFEYRELRVGSNSNYILDEAGAVSHGPRTEKPIPGSCGLGGS